MRRFFILSIFAGTILINTYAFVNSEKIFYSEFSINYSSIISPDFIENNTTGTLDAPYFSGKLGINILKWIDIYAGISFAFFVEQINKQQHYSFLPLYLGAKINMLPDFFICPSLYFETGRAFSNYHFLKYDIINMTLKEDNIPWTADYYNTGIAFNLKLNEIFTLILNIERPWLSFYEKDKNELHIINAGLSFKILY